MEKIMVRVYRNPKWHQQAGSPVIMWPLECATGVPGECMCWQRIGQHGSCDPWWMVRKTRPATVAEADAALKQWRREGPDRDELQFKRLHRLPSHGTIMGAHRDALESINRK